MALALRTNVPTVDELDLGKWDDGHEFGFKRVFADPNPHPHSSSLQITLYGVDAKQTLRYDTRFGQVLFDGLTRARTLLFSRQ